MFISYSLPLFREMEQEASASITFSLLILLFSLPDICSFDSFLTLTFHCLPLFTTECLNIPMPHILAEGLWDGCYSGPSLPPVLEHGDAAPLVPVQGASGRV